MAKGQVNLAVIKTNDDKLMLQVQEPDILTKVVENNITIHDDVDALLKCVKQKLNRAGM